MLQCCYIIVILKLCLESPFAVPHLGCPRDQFAGSSDENVETTIRLIQHTAISFASIELRGTCSDRVCPALSISGSIIENTLGRIVRDN